MKTWKLCVIAAVVVVLLPTAAAAERVIIQVEKPYGPMVARIEAQGGTVLYQYRYVDGIAVDVPDAVAEGLRKGLPPGTVHKDLIVPSPDVARDPDGTRRLVEVDASDATVEATASTDAYLISNTNLNLDSVHAMGEYGDDVVVAILDEGYRPGFPHLEYGWSSVIGGEDLTGDSYGWSNWLNGGHGTFVGGMVAAHVAFNMNPVFTAVVAYNCPQCVDTDGYIPMIGSAPLADLYMVKVLSNEVPTYVSTIIHGMERVLELKDSYMAGDPVVQNPDGSYDALDIGVCNMSLGWYTLFSGRELAEQLTNAFLEHDIVLTVSMGNEGPAGMTGGAPGSGFGALTVGAASSDIHERIRMDLAGGLGYGDVFRPWPGIQTAIFSSRGPTPDGRVDPEVVANGDWNFGQGFASATNLVNLGSGTSFSSPSVAGVAAVLRGAFPDATAREVRNALMLTANPNLLVEGSGPLDQGAGYVDGQAAYDMLLAGTAPDTPGVEGGVNPNVKVNILQGADVTTYDGNVTRMVSGLLPGQRFETFYRVLPNTAAVVVTVTDFNPGSPQNLLFGNDLILTVHTAKTSRLGDYLYASFVTTTDPLVFSALDEGLMRVTLTGDWTNAAPVDGVVTISSLSDPVPGVTSQAKLADGDVLEVPFRVPGGTSSLDAHLAWKEHWGRYPVNDIDLYLIDPTGVAFYDGATLASPERVHIDDPRPGRWTAVVVGYTVYEDDDRFELQLEADGTLLKEAKN